MSRSQHVDFAAFCVLELRHFITDPRAGNKSSIITVVRHYRKVGFISVAKPLSVAKPPVVSETGVSKIFPVT